MIVLYLRAEIREKHYFILRANCDVRQQNIKLNFFKHFQIKTLACGF